MARVPISKRYAAIQAIGCIATRACHTNSCSVGIATQEPHPVSRLVIAKSAAALANVLSASVELMQGMAHACCHSHLAEFNTRDHTTRDGDMCRLSGVSFAGESQP